MANISLWSSPTLHRSALNIAEFLHFISQIAFVKNKFASYLALKSTKLCDFSLVFLSPFLEIYYSNSIKWPTLPLSLLQALTPPFDPHHNLNSQFSALQYVLQFTKLLLPSKLLQAPPLPHATLRFNSNLPLSFLLFLKIAILIYQMAKKSKGWQTMSLSFLPAPTQSNPPHFCSWSCSCSCNCICQIFALQQLLQALHLLLFLSLFFAPGSSSLPSPSHFLSQSSPLPLTFPWNSQFKSNQAGNIAIVSPFICPALSLHFFTSSLPFHSALHLMIKTLKPIIWS